MTTKQVRLSARQALILAAGRGTRLGPLTVSMPKCLVKVGRKRLIDYQIESLLQNGFGRMVIVTGYKAGMVKRYVERTYPRLKVEFVTNTQYLSTGPAYSLGLAQKQLPKEFLLLVGDVMCTAADVKKLAFHQQATVVGASSYLPRKKDVGILVGRKMRVTKLGKKLALQKNYYEFAGMIKIGRAFRKRLFVDLDKLNMSENQDLLVEAISHTLARTNGHIQAVDLGESTLVEVDTMSDFRLANRILGKN